MWLQERKNNYYEALENKGKFIPKREKLCERFNFEESRVVGSGSLMQNIQVSAGNKNILNLLQL